jgi:hypothetical protein
MFEDLPRTLFGNPVAGRYLRKAQRSLQRNARKYRFDPAAQYPLEIAEHPELTRHLGMRLLLPGKGDAAVEPELDPAQSVVIGTIRMGYGHYRIGIALASAARALGKTPLWFDLLAFESPGARLIRDLDYWYSLASRLSQRSTLFNRWVWEPLTATAFRRVEKNYPILQTCRLFTDVYGALPRTVPFLGTHPWPAQAAVFAGLERVVNVVPDNCPLGFHLAEGAKHTVQSPSAYWSFRMFREMSPPGQTWQGLPADDLLLAGHYVDHELVTSIEVDCAARCARLDEGAPRRLLISMGGAGAQQDLLIGLVRHLLPAIHDERATLVINFGDHHAAWERFQRAVPELAQAAHRYRDWPALERLVAAARSKPLAGVHVVLQDDVFSAVYATNLLMPVCDVLITKPSELAYYPIPKLMLPRVGGHEAWGAIRASELGDGSVECTTAAACAQSLDAFIDDGAFLRLCCERIVALKPQGVYDGAYRAVAYACGQAPRP